MTSTGLLLCLYHSTGPEPACCGGWPSCVCHPFAPPECSKLKPHTYCRARWWWSKKQEAFSIYCNRDYPSLPFSFIRSDSIAASWFYAHWTLNCWCATPFTVFEGTFFFFCPCFDGSSSWCGVCFVLNLRHLLSCNSLVFPLTSDQDAYSAVLQPTWTVLRKGRPIHKRL